MDIQDEKQYSITGKIIRFEGKHAIIELEGGNNLAWPSARLPHDANEGSSVVLKIRTPQSEAQEKEDIAKAILNQVLESE